MLNQATAMAPAIRRQNEQWQTVSSNACASASYLTFPQKHPPVSMRTFP